MMDPSSKWMCGLIASGLAAIAIFAVACTSDELPKDEVCRDVGYSVANRVFACLGDGQLANQRYEQVWDGFNCNAADIERAEFDFENGDFGRYTEGALYQCPAAVRNVTCEQVAAYGDNLAAWIAEASPMCPIVMTPKDGTPQSDPDAGVGEDADAETF